MIQILYVNVLNVRMRRWMMKVKELQEIRQSVESNTKILGMCLMVGNFSKKFTKTIKMRRDNNDLLINIINCDIEILRMKG